MAPGQDAARGMDFWAALGVKEEAPDQLETTVSTDTHTAGHAGAATTLKATPAEPEANDKAAPVAVRAQAAGNLGASSSDTQHEWASMFSNVSWPKPADGDAPSAKQTAPPRPATSDATAPQTPDRSRPVHSPAQREAESSERIQALTKIWSLFDELWRDDRLYEVHIRGTAVTVCGTLGIYQAAGFPDLAAAREAVDAVTAAQQEIGAVITQLGGSVVVRRSNAAGPKPAALVAASIITEEQLSQVERAVGRMQAVTVTGPAAPVIMRSFAWFIPAGSRVFQGPFAVLPADCVVARSPMDADYVVGVRPGAVAESMAAAGQVGALIANPRTPFLAPVRLIVSGRSAAPKKVIPADRSVGSW